MRKEDLIFAEILIVTMGMALLLQRKRSRKWQNRQWWVRPINRMRPYLGDFYYLLQEMKDDPQMFFRYTRMTVPIFYKLLEMTRASLTKRNHRALVPEERLAITLRYDFFNKFNLIQYLHISDQHSHFYNKI